MVVSEMGEQWSPKTEPARMAESVTIESPGAILSQMVIPMGIRMPKVPHEVPVAKDSTAEMINSIAGIKATGIEEAATKAAT